jgi:DNA-binding NtrC family response regulator
MPDQAQILVIDDNDFIRMQIVSFLQGGGYGVSQANNAGQAINLIKEKSNNFRCMLVDVRMEPVDGFDFLNKITAENITIPTILVTGDQNADILTKASEYGVSSVLMKPVNKDRLLKVVEKTIFGANHVS